MTAALTHYNYTAKGTGLIAEIKALDVAGKQAKLEAHLRDSSDDHEVILDVFHHLLTQLIEKRDQGDENAKLRLNEDQLGQVLKIMKAKDQSFGYKTGNDFFQSLDQWSPSLFSQEDALIAAIAAHFPPHQAEAKPAGFQFDFPETFNAEIEEELRKKARGCQIAFSELMNILPGMQKAHRVRERYQQGSPDVTPADVAQAKSIYEENRSTYQTDAKVIAEGMPYVHGCYANYKGNFIVHQIYNQYLAKLLASREAKYPVENYVLKLATPDFNMTEPEFTLDEREEVREVTLDDKRAQYLGELQLITDRLESRYKKRKLMVALQKGTPHYQILNDLVKLAEKDPDDIKTHILLSRLIAEHGKSLTNTAKRVHYRELALGHCQTAFSSIDSYMDLQGIQDLSERDRMRVGFVKTISSIRNPLIRGK